jgi:hypothetical protein
MEMKSFSFVELLQTSAKELSFFIHNFPFKPLHATWLCGCFEEMSLESDEMLTLERQIV